MIESFILNIFPPGSLANSVTTTVWLGVCVTCFFNLRLGWVLSGLVVPGYLIPLLMVKPLSAAVIIFEAVITYFLVWLYSEYFSKSGLWNSFFGRDRFFALLLTSIIVRLIFDTILLPLSGEYVTRTFGIVFDYRNSLHSFGLIVVALLANQFWKPGLKKGFLQAFITLLTTWLLVRYVLIEFTNFNMGNIVYMYEDIASSMLSSPKAYIILLTTSIVASRMNLHYGWDFSGILIPSLLALQWYQPEKLVYTFLETFIILMIASLVLRLSIFREANMEGARKILLFFNVGFFYKLVLGWVIIHWFPKEKVTDFYGFGYLLTTLLAIKMHDKDIAVRVTRAVLQTSLAAVMAATCIGFAMTHIPNILSLTAQPLTRILNVKKEFGDQRLIDILKEDKVSLFTSLKKNSFVSPLPREMEIFSEALKSIEHYCVSKDINSLKTAENLLGRINYALAKVEGHYLYVYEAEPRNGWGSYVFNVDFKNPMILEVPAPLDEWGILEAGTWLFSALNAKALAFGGSGLKTNDDGTSDVLNNPLTLFAVFQRFFHDTNILQVRGHTQNTIKVLTGKRVIPTLGEPPVVDSLLWIKSSLPPGLDLVLLKNILGTFGIKWETSPFNNRLQDKSHSGFAVLMLNRHHARDLMFKTPFKGIELPVELSEQSIVGYLQDWLLRGKQKISEKGSGLYQVPRFEELLFFDHEILTPLLKLSRQLYSDKGWGPNAVNELKALNTSAAVMGYEIIQYRHKTSHQDYLILSERDDAAKRFWGSYIFRLGPSNPYLIQTPRPLSEMNVFEYSVSLFERTKALGLMISTAHPLTNPDGSSDIIRMQNKESLYTLVSQVMVREQGSDPLMIVQCRALGFKPDAPLPDTDALLSFRSGVKLYSQPDTLTLDLITSLKSNGLSIKLADGSKATAGYEVGGIPQAMYLDQSRNKEFAIIWLSPVIRAYFRQQTENKRQESQFRALGINTIEADLFATINTSRNQPVDLPGRFKTLIQTYIETHDIIVLDQILHQWPGLSYQRIIDLNSKQSFLLVFTKAKQLAAVINLFPKDMGTTLAVNVLQVTQERISHYIDARLAWLEWTKQ
ncbi:poly-gamma-glutamate biosynthesis protein PgsC/CapC [Desulfobacula phenolica]|uniref:Capsule biosynthesis CapC n=1 Tax=Desulfobacula phenolica TaxID=90732 RepID=A0A1H2JIC3_9BACT|nr:poly-gamma-glutamate biosynthesis protein PgsC/CapC [Desulfobacula phenolica]SDU55825.1 Capsule biosynthesis CapC [Desulfobacula phenolica]